MTDKPAADDAPLRADAARNRERILAAAEAVFVQRGADASLEEVAKQAGVGIGTLYRRFPTRDELLAALSDARLMAIADATRARDGAEPATAIRAYVTELVDHTTHYRGLAASLGAVLTSGTPGCHASGREGRRLLARAQAAGVVRPEVTLDDVVCMIMAISMGIEQDPSTRDRVDHRVDLFLGGIVTR